MKLTILAAGVLCAAAAPAIAQDAAGGGAPATPKTDLEWREWAPDPAAVEMPNLTFAETPEDVGDYQKYYYFNRADTSFAAALADIRQCDSYARGLFGGDYYPNPGTTAMYGLGGAIGGAMVGAIASAIYGSAEERRKRRVNMRRCMWFKGYDRYGLPKDLWEKFNFEEGNSKVEEPERQPMLALQAKAASGPRPKSEALGL